MDEKDIAQMEEHMAAAIDDYFAARPDSYSRSNQIIYQNAFKRAWRELFAITNPDDKLLVDAKGVVIVTDKPD